MPRVLAAAVTNLNLSKLSSILQLMFLLLNDSDAAPNIATSLAPALTAASNPLILGTRAEYVTPGTLSIPAITSLWSLICGIHFGETKLVASIYFKPVDDNLSINLIFASVGTIVY
jgi:hypothetical protein